MIKFNDDNIYVGYIKQLLSSFNLPKCPIGEKDFKQDSHYIAGNSLYFYDNKQKKSTRVSSYKEDDTIENLTKNLEIKNNFYDSYTHEYLGDYLRYVRDYKGLDLMSMYNCFSNASIENVEFSVRDSEFDSSSDAYTIFAIPVKYNQKYTLAIEWHGTIEMCCGYYSNGNLCKSNLNDGSIDNDDIVQHFTYCKQSGLRFNHPFVFDKLVNNSNFKNDYACEKDFKLFLKVPTICKSSIVVLEGDYEENASLFMQKRSIVINREDKKYLDVELNYLSKPQLLSMNYMGTYLLADRLVEYLSNQVITPIDPVINNIKRLQIKAKKEYNVPYTYLGIWEDNKLRNFLYTYIIDKGLFNKHCDLLSYLDKDVEGNNRGFDIEYIKTYYEDNDGNIVEKKEENNEWLIQ